MLLQHLLEVPTRVTGGMVRHLLWGAAHHDLTTLVAAFWTQIDDPVGAADHVKVVLDHQDRVALVDQALHHIHELVDVIEAQTRGGFVDQIQGLAGGPFRQLGG